MDEKRHVGSEKRESAMQKNPFMWRARQDCHQTLEDRNASPLLDGKEGFMQLVLCVDGRGAEAVL